MNKEFKSYYKYLRKRSLFGYFYRKFWLYPILCRYLDGTVLDVGCGIGDMLSYRKNTIGVDINPETVNFCRSNGNYVKLMHNNILPFDDIFFDGVILDNVLEHILDPVPLLTEVNRVLKYNGKVLIGVPGIKGYSKDPDHKKFYDLDELTKEVSSANFSLIKHFYMPFEFKFLNIYMRQYCLYAVFLKH